MYKQLNTSKLKLAIFPEYWVLERFQTAKVTIRLTQAHQYSCQLIGHI